MRRMFREGHLEMSATDIGGLQLVITSVAFAFNIGWGEMLVNLCSGYFFIGDGVDSTWRPARRRERAELFAFITPLPQAHQLTTISEEANYDAYSVFHFAYRSFLSAHTRTGDCF